MEDPDRKGLPLPRISKTREPNFMPRVAVAALGVGEIGVANHMTNVPADSSYYDIQSPVRRTERTQYCPERTRGSLAGRLAAATRALRTTINLSPIAHNII